jgi:DNA mismatch repair protein MutS2
MEVEVPVTDVGFMKGKSLPSAGTIRTAQNDEAVALQVDLRGLRVDEAVSKLEYFLNRASLAELREVTIIHGIGKGLLLKAAHEHLGGHPLVKSFRIGTIDEGGNGVTVVILK